MTLQVKSSKSVDTIRGHYNAYDYAATYTHGYNLPDMSGADTLPYDIQQAALELCKGMWLARQRDPAVSMESVPDVYTVQYGGQGNGGALVGAIPLNVQELLLPYRPKPNTDSVGELLQVPDEGCLGTQRRTLGVRLADRP
jgi:hypothetical protein